VKRGLAIKIPARAERFVYHGKEVVVDGAHNPQKLAALTELIKTEYPSARIGILATVGENKAASLNDNLRVLREISSEMVITSFRDTTIETAWRVSLPSEIVAEAARAEGFKKVAIEANAAKALEGLVKERRYDLILVCGSFYLLNDVRPMLLKG
jgi:dihydrofolate synthase/folylpolyglutamate synthase